MARRRKRVLKKRRRNSKRKPNAYAKCVGLERRAGKSFKGAARACKVNPVNMNPRIPGLGNVDGMVIIGIVLSAVGGWMAGQKA